MWCRGPRSLNVNDWATSQAYIALGNFMTSAAVLGVDTCPLEGIEPAGYDKVLNLLGSGFATVVACAAGHRSAADKYAELAKVRYPHDENGGGCVGFGRVCRKNGFVKGGCCDRTIS